MQDIDALFILFLGRGLESMNILRANIENVQVSEKKIFRVDGLVSRKSHEDIERIVVGVKHVNL